MKIQSSLILALLLVTLVPFAGLFGFFYLSNSEQIDRSGSAAQSQALALADSVDVGEIALKITASLGVASSTDLGVADAATLIRLADEALYRAKEKGRNRTEAASDETDGAAT